MNILVIANHLLTSEIASGGDRIFVEMAKRWRQWGAKIFLVAPEVGVDNVAAEIGVEETVVIPASPFDKLQEKAVWAIFPLYLWRTLKVFGLLTPHLFPTQEGAGYTTGDFFCDVLPAFYLKRKFGRKWIANIYHINEPPFVRKGNGFLATTASFLLQRFSFSLIKREADVIFLSNQKVKGGLVKLGFNPQKFFVTGWGGIDLRKSKEQRVKSKIYEGVFLGRLNPTKGIFDLPKIWQKVVEKIPSARLVLIGGGEKWLGELQKQINTAGLKENITIAGFVDEEDKYKLLSQSKIFVFPSYEEGWGMAVAEALAAGLPVVAYDLPSYREVFPNAFPTVKIGDTAAMAQMILNLLQNESDHRSWREKGYNVVQRYDLDQIAKEQWEIIRVRLG